MDVKSLPYRVGKIFLFAFLVFIFTWDAGYATRIKDLVNIQGVRSNQLVGYGLVVGLNGTGDKSNTIFTNQSLANMLEKMGVRIDPKSTKVNNIAAVMVIANLPPFGRVGSKFDATVSSIGDAKSIEGGILLFTPLKGADGETYAVAQGPVVVGGFLAGGQAATVTKNHPTVGRVANGVTIERELNFEPMRDGNIILALKSPDFTTARRIVEGVNGMFQRSSRAKDGGTIEVKIPDQYRSDPVKFVSLVEGINVKVDSAAKVVVDEKTGTVVIGENVVIATCAVSHGNITVQVKEEQRVSQPMPFSRGETVVSPETRVRVEEEKGKFYLMPGSVTIKELVNALNAVGLSTRDVITILQTIKAAGALHAELEVM